MSRLLVASLVLLAVTVDGAAHPAVGNIEGRSDADRGVLLYVLPGVTIDELANPGLPHLSRLVHSSSGAWVAVWQPLERITRFATSVEPVLLRDPDRPYGIRCDAGATAERVRRALRKEAAVWLDPGDTGRAASYAPLCLPAKSQEHRRAAVREADRLLGDLLRDGGPSELWLLAPPMDSGRSLALYFRLRAGGRPGLLRSGSTHMMGVVTGPDLPATLAERVGALPPPAGRRVQSVTWPVDAAAFRWGPGFRPVFPPAGRLAATGGDRDRTAVAELRRLGDLVERTERVRAVGNRGVKWLLLIVLLAALAAVWTGRRLPGGVIQPVLLLPGVLLAEGALRAGHVGLGVVLLLLLVGAAGWAWVARRREGPHPRPLPQRLGEGGLRARTSRLSTWQAAAGAVSVAFVLALLQGDCMRWAVLGYSVPLGVRFYGVGNEFMGWWVGAALLAVAGGGPLSGVVQVVALLAVAVLIGHPGLGANAGGGITALAAAGVAAWPALRRRPGVAVAAFGAAFLVLAAVMVWDAARPLETQTHLGRMAARVAQDGLGPMVEMAWGKIGTNLRLSMTFWGLLCAAGVLMVWVARRRVPEAKTTQVVSRLLPVAVVAFLVNDSGVIAAALMLTYSVVAMVRSGDGELA